MPGVAGFAIAGLWYVILGLLAPCVALRRARRGEDPQWRAAWRALGLAGGALLAFVATAAVLHAVMGRWRSANLLQTLAFSGGAVMAVLLGVLLTVQGLVVLERRRVSPSRIGSATAGGKAHEPADRRP